VAVVQRCLCLRAIFNIPTIDAYFVGKKQTSIPILARADFSTIKTPAFTGDSSNYLVDNLDDKYVMMFTDYHQSAAPLRLGHLDGRYGHGIHTDIDLSSMALGTIFWTLDLINMLWRYPRPQPRPSTAVVVSKQSFTVTDTFTAAALGQLQHAHFGTVVSELHFVSAGRNVNGQIPLRSSLYQRDGATSARTGISNHIILRSQIAHRETPTTYKAICLGCVAN
jgi:hypothetical protein